MTELKYEEALKRLEQLVAQLESAELALEARLKKFEEGTKLARLLHKRLEQAKKRVEMLSKPRGGEGAIQPFDDADDDDDAEEAAGA
ncbi:MAG TPA: exodeoxyribonuclease VII small subunit [bacterium]